MFRVADAPVNLQWMSWEANLAKGSLSVADMSNVDPLWQAEQVALEDSTYQALENIIAQLLKSQG